MKNQRHEAILEIIGSCNVETQETLKKLLSERGIEVTQATLSRDIRELGLIKKEKGYRVSERHLSEVPLILREAVIGVDYAMNTVVFKCHAGMAMAACATIDRMEYQSAVGTLAGDDTIFMLMRTEKEAAAFAKDMRRVIFTKETE